MDQYGDLLYARNFYSHIMEEKMNKSIETLLVEEILAIDDAVEGAIGSERLRLTGLRDKLQAALKLIREATADEVL